jgi:GNAT superfamily N-acetyltransferase
MPMSSTLVSCQRAEFTRREITVVAELVIRNAFDGERTAISDITLAAYQEYGAVLPAEHWQRYREDILRTLAEAKLGEQIVAVRHGAVVGAVLLYPAGTVFSAGPDKSVTLAWPELRLLAVPPGLRGQGIGAALVWECIDRARRSGGRVLALHTTDMMKVAMAMYERMGFTRAPELDFKPAPDLTIKGFRLDLEGRIP